MGVISSGHRNLCSLESYTCPQRRRAGSPIGSCLTVCNVVRSTRSSGITTRRNLHSENLVSFRFPEHGEHLCLHAIVFFRFAVPHSAAVRPLLPTTRADAVIRPRPTCTIPRKLDRFPKKHFLRRSDAGILQLWRSSIPPDGPSLMVIRGKDEPRKNRDSCPAERSGSWSGIRTPSPGVTSFLLERTSAFEDHTGTDLKRNQASSCCFCHPQFSHSKIYGRGISSGSNPTSREYDPHSGHFSGAPLSCRITAVPNVSITFCVASNTISASGRVAPP